MTELLIVAGRIVTILPLILFIAIFMGKRAIGELPVFDFLIVLILGSVVGADIADPNIQHLHTAVAITLIGIMQRFVSELKISHRRIGKYITFEPTIVVQDGKIIRENLEKIRYSIDNVLEALREKDVFDVSEVETAIIEANGSLSVLKKPMKSTVTIEDMNLTKASSSIAFPAIVDGIVYTKVLHMFHVDEVWLQQQLKSQGIDRVEEVFFASINRNLELHISLKDEPDTLLPPIYN